MPVDFLNQKKIMIKVKQLVAPSGLNIPGKTDEYHKFSKSEKNYGLCEQAVALIDSSEANKYL